MGASEGTSRCQRASEYYYDLLHPDGGPVPQAVKQHVARCPSCQERVRRLAEILLESQRAASLPAAQADEQMIEVLRQHFDWLDEPVVCSHVKPFLAGLLVPAPQVRIPTPITAHVDRCPQCARDLAALRALNLTAEQLERLSRLYEASDDRDPGQCRQARSALVALGSLSAEGIEARILRHIRMCPRCRDELYRQRGRLPDTDRREAPEGAALSCDDVSTADLFNLVVPCDAPAASDKADRTKAIAAHVRSCCRCVERMQAEHRTIYGIAERPDSGIATVYDAGGGVRTVSEEVADGSASHSAAVQLGQNEPEPVASDSESGAAPAAVLRCRGAGLGRRSFVKIALAAVVVSVLSALFFTNAPTASGTNVGEILKALEKAPNIHVITLGRRSLEPAQEIWVARALNLLIMKTRDRCVVYDFQGGRKRVTDPGLGAAAPTKLTEEEYQGSRSIVASCVGGLLATVSRGAELYSVASTAAGPQGLVVYELTADTGGYGGSALPHRFRVSVDPATRLPQRIEFYRREPPTNEWELGSIRVFEYLTEQGMRDVLKTLLPPE